MQKNDNKEVVQNDLKNFQLQINRKNICAATNRPQKEVYPIF